MSGDLFGPPDLGGMRLPESAGLPIAAMASIFTVVLVVLLRSLPHEASPFPPGKDVALPEAKVAEELPDAPTLAITPDAIVLGGRMVQDLKSLAFAEGSIPVLDEALTAEHRGGASAPGGGRLLLIADRRVPYSTVKRVLASCAKSGFTDLQLVVSTEE